MWIRRSVEENIANVADINTTCLVLWNECLFTPIQDRLIPSLLSVILKDRKGESIDTGLVAKITNSFVMFGINPINNVADSTEIYQKCFEVPFIADTEAFYKSESAGFIGENPVTEYMKRVILVDLLVPLTTIRQRLGWHAKTQD